MKKNKGGGKASLGRGLPFEMKTLRLNKTLCLAAQAHSRFKLTHLLPLFAYCVKICVPSTDQETHH